MPSIIATMSVATFKEKVDGFVNRFHQKAEHADLTGEIATREEQVTNILSNVSPEALDSFTEVVAELTTIRNEMQSADGSLEQATLLLAQQATAATQSVQSDLNAYKISNDNNINGVANSLGNSISVVGSDLATYQTSNDARVAEVEEKIDYVADQLPQASGGNSSQA